MELDVTITEEQEFDLAAVLPKTAGGHDAQLDGPVTFTVVSGDCTLTPLDDRRCTVRSGAAGMTSDISASADADLGAGVITITDVVHVHVLSAMAADLGLQAGAPRLKPVPTP